MKEPVWILDSLVPAIHSELLSEHGGGSGIRDETLLESALARPKQKYSYDPDSSLFSIAASYSFGLAKNHPFVDGNKRTAFVIGVLFLEMNGYMLNASEPSAALMFENMAAGKIDENQLSDWFEGNIEKV